MRVKRRGPVLIGIAVSAFFLWVAFRGVSTEEVWGHLAAANPVLLGLAVLNHTLGIHIRALRWKYLLAPVTGPIPLGPRVSATAIGIAANNVIPLRVGEFARVLVLARQTGTAIPLVLGTIVMERLFDGLAMVASVFIVMAMPSFPATYAIGGVNPAAAARTLLLVAGGVGILLTLLATLPEPSVRLAESATRILPRSWRRPIVDALRSFVEGLGVLRSPRHLLLSIGWATAQWTFLALGFYLGFLAFGIDAPGFAGAVFFQAIIGFAVAVPSTPGFFGPWEAASRYALAIWGVEEARAVSFAVAFHAGAYLVMTGLGAFHLWRLGLRWRDVRESAKAVEVAVEAELEIPEEGKG